MKTMWRKRSGKMRKLSLTWRGKILLIPCRGNHQKRPAFGPQLEVWVDSWKVKNDQTHFAWVNVYAYYNSKDKSYGGYGVILRDLFAKPITASAKFSADGKSFYTQLLMGMMAGLTLAERHGHLDLRLECNSIKIQGLIDQLWNCPNEESKTLDDTCVCKRCLLYFTRSKGCDISLVPLVREVKALSPKGSHPLGMIRFPRNSNRPAHYLAKMGKKNKEERTAPGDEDLPEIKPGDFPQELKEILWEMRLVCCATTRRVDIDEGVKCFMF
ncbi:hypothetical protein MKX01_009761 [Papaver californicum]|nr:hypothetical protein MKX01_009761 [Papaver californicum]